MSLKSVCVCVCVCVRACVRVVGSLQYYYIALSLPPTGSAGSE